MRILITRPRESAAALASRLQELGHQVTIAPLIHLTPVSKHLLKLPPPSCFEAIVTTSQQAIRCLANLTSQRDFPLWCVGTESARIAQELGFQTIHAAEGTAENLVAKLLKTLIPPFQKPVLHASGDVIRVNVAEALQAKGIPAQRIIVYKTEEAVTFPSEIQSALKMNKLDVALFYSPRTARIFRNLCQTAGLDPYCSSLTALCLSEGIAAEIRHLPWKTIHIAKKTSTDDLLMILMMADQ